MKNLLGITLILICCIAYGSGVELSEVKEILDATCTSMKAVADVLGLLPSRRKRALDDVPIFNQIERSEKYIEFENDKNCGRMTDVREKLVQAFSEHSMVKMKDVMAVVNQKVAAVAAWPWLVNIVQPYEEGVRNKSVLCSGTLIKGRWVLTAAHCVSSLESDNLKRLVVMISGDNIMKIEEHAVNVTNIYKHDNYDRETHENDIALLKLSDDVTVTQDTAHVSPACVSSGNSQDSPISSRKCHVTSFRSDADQGIPQLAPVRIETSERCSQYGMDNPKDESLLCVSAGQMDQYFEGTLRQLGDGGAIVCKDENQNNEVVAVRSRVEQNMIIFTKTRNYVDWMNNIVE